MYDFGFIKAGGDFAKFASSARGNSSELLGWAKAWAELRSEPGLETMDSKIRMRGAYGMLKQANQGGDQESAIVEAPWLQEFSKTPQIAAEAMVAWAARGGFSDGLNVDPGEAFSWTQPQCLEFLESLNRSVASLAPALESDSVNVEAVKKKARTLAIGCLDTASQENLKIAAQILREQQPGS